MKRQRVIRISAPMYEFAQHLEDLIGNVVSGGEPNEIIRHIDHFQIIQHDYKYSAIVLVTTETS